MPGAPVSPELELVRRLAGCAERRRVESRRIAELLHTVDYDVLAAELDRQRLLALVGSRVADAGGDTVPAAFSVLVTDARTRARARGLGLELSARRVLDALSLAGIRALVLKGTALACAAHADIGLREASDIDVLVHRDQLHGAVAQLIANGCSPLAGAPAPGRLPDLHLTVVDQSLTPIELHWRLHWYETRFSGDMLARASRGPEGILEPAPADLAAALLLFYARDGFFGLRLAADIAAWSDRNVAELPPGVLAAHIRDYPALAPALSAAAQVAQTVTGVPSTAWLGGAAAPTRRVSLAMRLGNWPQQGDADQARAEISLVGGLLGPIGSFPAFVRRELVHKQEGVRATAVHTVKMCVRYALGAWRALRSRDVERRG